MYTIVSRFLKSPKNILLSGSIALSMLIFAVLPATALAVPQATQVCGLKDVSCVIQFGDQKISERLTALNKLDATVTADQTDHTIDDAHAALLHSDIQTNITGLNTLKTTLDAETDAKTARQNVAEIYTQFRIYAVVLPRDYRRLHLSIEITVDAALSALETPTGALVANASANQTELNSLFSDYKAQLSAAESNIAQAQQTWPLLTVDSYNGDRATYATNAKNLATYEQTAHTDLHKAAADLHQIAQDLKLV
jgi:hypothetical protein